MNPAIAARQWVWPCLLTLLLGPAANAEIDVLTQHNGADRTGANLEETRLNTANVKAGFRKLCFRLLDGNAYAQPLYASKVAIAGRASPRNVVLVATENNTVFALDADDVNQASTTFTLWKSAQLGAPIPSEDLSRLIRGDPAFCTDLTPQVGITSTPVISPDKKTVYVVAKSVVATSPRLRTAYTLHALNMADGKPARAPVPIEAEVAGTGMGSVAGRIAFDPDRQFNRAALLLSQGILYIGFAGHCDTPPFHGWLLAYDTPSLARLDAFNTTPNVNSGDDPGEGGIWQSGQGPAADAAGNLYLSTGNGSNNASTPGAPNTDFGDSVLRLRLNAATGRKIRVDDWFTPSNQAVLNRDDADLGSSGPALLPGTHLMVAGGKEGRLYLLDRDQFGRGLKPSVHSIQVTNPPVNSGMPHPIYWNIHGSPVVWNHGTLISIYLCGEEDKLKQFTLIPDASPAGWRFEGDTPKASRESAPLPNPPNGDTSPTRREPVIMPGGILSLSSDGEKPGTGIIWVSMPLSASANRAVTRGILRAYDASNVGLPELWDSERTPGDSVGMYAKFVPPTIADGKVFLPAFAEEIIGNDGIHRVKPPSQGGLQPALAIYGLP